MMTFLKTINMKVVAEMEPRHGTKLSRTPSESHGKKSFHSHPQILFHVVVVSGMV